VAFGKKANKEKNLEKYNITISCRNCWNHNIYGWKYFLWPWVSPPV